MSLRRSAVWAVGDSALSSLASFAVGIYAVRALTLAELGGYGVLFVSTFVLAGASVTQLYFTPAEVKLLDHPPDAQLAGLRRSAARGLPIASVIGVVTTSLSLLVIPELGVDDRLLLGVGALAIGVLSPTQDHVRRVLHQAGQSASALGVSAVQLLGAVGALALLATTDAPRVVLPFAALAAANLTSLTAGVVLARLRRRPGTVPPSPAPLRNLLRMGSWLLLSGQAEQLSGFVGIALLSRLAGVVAVGQYEAARQLAQPLFVLSTGLQSVFRPRVMTATRERNGPAVGRLTRAFMGVLTLAGAVATLTVGQPWAANPLVDLFPNAYEHAGVYPLLLVASTFAFSIPIFVFQAIAARRERSLVVLTGTTSFVYVALVAVLARPLGALALPAASLGNTAVWLLRFRPLRRSIFAGPSPVTEPAAPPVPAEG